ncbi:hypothetical protein AAY473_002212 [Plecturocebus cupreus]
MYENAWMSRQKFAARVSSGCALVIQGHRWMKAAPSETRGTSTVLPELQQQWTRAAKSYTSHIHPAGFPDQLLIPEADPHPGTTFPRLPAEAPASAQRRRGSSGGQGSRLRPARWAPEKPQGPRSVPLAGTAHVPRVPARGFPGPGNHLEAKARQAEKGLTPSRGLPQRD